MDLYYILAVHTTGNQIKAEQASLNRFTTAVTTITTAFIIFIWWQIFIRQICYKKAES